jgi:hypothetical protein
MVDNYRLTRKFRVFAVDETDPKGPGARVFRVKLPKNPEVTGAAPEDEAEDESGGEE